MLQRVVGPDEKRRAALQNLQLVVGFGKAGVGHMGHKAGRVVTGHGHNDLAARLFVLRGKVIAQLLHGGVGHFDAAQVLVHQRIVVAVVGGGVDNIQRRIVHIVVAVALDGDQEAEPRLVLRHGLVHRFPVAVGGRVGLVRAVPVGLLRGKIALEMGLVKAQRQPGGVAAVVGVRVGVGGHRGVAQTLEVADNAVGVVQVQPVERRDAGHQDQRVGGQHLVLGGVCAAAHMGADRVAVDRVGQVLGDRHDVGVGLQVGDKVKVVEALGQDQHNVGVVLSALGAGRGDVVVGLAGGVHRRGVVAVVLRLNDRVGHQAGGLNRPGQIAVGVVGVLPRPAVGRLGLDGHGAEVAEEHDQKHAQCAARRPHAAGLPAGALRRTLDQLRLHECNRQNRQVEQHDLHNVLRDFQGVAAHDLGGGAEVQNVLGHQRRAVQVAGVVVDECNDGEHRTRNARCAAPLAEQRKQNQRQAKGGQRVERRVERPLKLQKALGHAVGQLQLIAGDEPHRYSQQAGEHPLQEKFLPVKVFQMLHR